MNEALESWWSWLAAASLQSGVLFALAWTCDRLFARRAWPQVLLVLWLAAFARLCLPPTFESRWSVTTAVGAPTIEFAARSASSLPLASFAALWALGAAACVLARVVRGARVRSATELYDPSDARLEPWREAVARAAHSFSPRRAPRIATLANLSQPAVFGVVRPTLLLPASWLARAPRRDDLHAVLHEIAHLKRGDLWLDGACELLRALFWFHPLVWLAVRRVRALTELACDASVARHLGPKACGYRETLVRAAREMLVRPAPAGSRAFLAHGSSIVLRIERLQRATNATLLQIRVCSAALAIALGACVLPMAAHDSELRRVAQGVFDAELSGTPQSCFSLRAAAMVLAADHSSTHPPSDS